MGAGGRGKGALGGRRADPGEGLRAPGSEHAAARGSRSRRSEPQGGEEGERALGRPVKEPAAGGIPEPAPLPSARPHLPSLAFLFPSALRARRPGALLPFPWGAQPGSSRLPFPPRPGAPAGASVAGAVMGYEAPSPGGAGARPASRRGGRPPPEEKNWLPLTAEPVVRAGASKGVSSPALRWPLRYTSEGFTRTLSTDSGCARGSCSGDGCVDLFGGLKPGRETGWPTRAPGYNKTQKRTGGRGQ